MIRTPAVTMVIPYYNQPSMLIEQLKTWDSYSHDVRSQMRIIVVDDGSKTPALETLRAYTFNGLSKLPLQLYRILDDIPWNRGGARNLGSYVADTTWLLHMDIDHVLLPESASNIVKMLPAMRSDVWFRFRRYRYGEADETRKKDALPEDVRHGEIKPHIDSYLCTKDLYAKVGGYDEDYSGCLGGGSPFLQQMGEVAGPPNIFPLDVSLTVFTRHTCYDASVTTLSRDTSEYARRKKKKQLTGNTKATNPLRFKWERQL